MKKFMLKSLPSIDKSIYGPWQLRVIFLLIFLPTVLLPFDTFARLQEDAILLQNPDYPTGCEGVSVTYILQKNQIPVCVEDVLALIPTTKVQYHNGKPYGYHPEEGFTGNPRGHGFGVYPEAFIDRLNQYLSSLDADFRFVLLQQFDEIREDTALWITIGLVPTNFQYSGYYIMTGDGEFTGEYYHFPANEHCVAVLAVENSLVKVMDPLKGICWYPLDLVEKRYIEQGSHAMATVPYAPFALFFKDNPPVYTDRLVNRNGVILIAVDFLDQLGMDTQLNNNALTIYDSEHTFTFTHESPLAEMDSLTYPLTWQPIWIENNFVSLRFLANFLGLEMTWAWGTDANGFPIQTVTLK